MPYLHKTYGEPLFYDDKTGEWRKPETPEEIRLHEKYAKQLSKSFVEIFEDNESDQSA